MQDVSKLCGGNKERFNYRTHGKGTSGLICQSNNVQLKKKSFYYSFIRIAIVAGALADVHLAVKGESLSAVK